MAAGFAKLVLVMGLGVAGCSSPEDMQRDVGVDQDKAAAAKGFHAEEIVPVEANSVASMAFRSRRRAAWTPPAPHARSERGYLKLYLDHASQAGDGVDFDFLTKVL